MLFSSTAFVFLLAVLASAESLALPDQGRFPTLSNDDHVHLFSGPSNDDHVIDLSAFEADARGPISSGPHEDSFRHDVDVDFNAPVILDDFFHREENDAFTSSQLDEDFNFHPELFHSGEGQGESLSRTRDRHGLLDTQKFPTIYYPESDISAGNNIAPDYHVKAYPDNYRQVKEPSDPKHPDDDHHVLEDQAKDHQEKGQATSTSSVNDFSVEQSAGHQLPDAKFPEAPKATTNFFGSENFTPLVQDYPKSNEVVILSKNRPRNKKSVPRRAAGVERQFDSSDFFDFDYSSSGGSSDPFEGNYDGDYYAPGDDDSTVHVGNDAAYDYDYSNSHGPDLSSGFSSFSEDFARTSGVLPNIHSTKQKK